MQEQILPINPANTSRVSEIVSVERGEDTWTYFLGCYPIMRHRAASHREMYLTLVKLVHLGHCRQCEVLKCFGLPKRTFDNWRIKYERGGTAAFFASRLSGGKGRNPILTREVLQDAQELLDTDFAVSEISQKLDVKDSTLRKAIQDGRLNRPPPDKARLGTCKSERTVTDAAAADGMGTACTRTVERTLAAFGKIHGPSTECMHSTAVSMGAVLCALPALLSNGLLEGAEDILGKIKGYYTKTQILLLFGYMAMCRIKNIEQLYGYPPGEFGIVLGLDRSPQQRCLRQKSDLLAGNGNAEAWEQHLSSFWMNNHPEICGRLYVDGHVSVYHGRSTKLPRRFVSRERLCLRGLSSYWVNDFSGRPFFHVEKQIDSGLIATLREDIIPRLLLEVPGQPSDEKLAANPRLCRFIIVCDREIYSPEFIKEMWIKYRVAILSYHKFPKDDWPVELFEECEVLLVNGETVKMRLAEKESFIGSAKNGCPVREIRKLTDSGHQTSIITTLFEPPAKDIAPMMFARWCQENFFRYMKEHFMFDALTQHGTEPFSGTERVVNPQWRELEKKRNSMTSKLHHRRARFAEIKLNDLDGTPKTTQKKELRMAELHDEIMHIEIEIEKIKEEKKQTCKHIKWEDLPDDKRFYALSTSRKNLFETIKMIAYRAETAMAEQLTSKTVSQAEARVLLRNLFVNDADIIPDEEKKLLRVVVHGAANPASNKAIARLLNLLNETETFYPGTELKLVFESAVMEIKDEIPKQCH